MRRMRAKRTWPAVGGNDSDITSRHNMRCCKPDTIASNIGMQASVIRVIVIVITTDAALPANSHLWSLLQNREVLLAAATQSCPLTTPRDIGASAEPLDEPTPLTLGRCRYFSRMLLNPLSIRCTSFH